MSEEFNRNIWHVKRIILPLSPFLPPSLFFPLSLSSTFFPFLPSFLLHSFLLSTLSSLIWGRWYLTLSKEIIYLFQNPYAFSTQSTELEGGIWDEFLRHSFFPSESRAILQVSNYFQIFLQQSPILHTTVCDIYPGKVVFRKRLQWSMKNFFFQLIL